MGLPITGKLSKRQQITAASSGHMPSGNCGDLHQEGKGGKVGNRPGDGKEGVGSKRNCAGCLGSAHLRFLCTLFRTSGGWGSKADERVIYEQTGHQDGVVRKLWRSVWTCG